MADGDDNRSEAEQIHDVGEVQEVAQSQGRVHTYTRQVIIRKINKHLF